MEKCTREVELDENDKRDRCESDKHCSYGKHITSLITMILFVVGFTVATIITPTDIRYLYGIIALYFGVIFAITTAYYAVQMNHSVICNVRNWSISAWTNPFFIFVLAVGVLAG